MTDTAPRAQHTPRSPFVPDLLEGRCVVVTGGSAGIGLEISKQLLLHGARVAVVSRQPERLEGAARLLAEQTGREPLTVACDVREWPAVEAMADRVRREYGAVDAVVNNAAANFRMAAERMTPRAFRTVVDIDLMGTFHVTRAFVGPMLERGEGSVLSIVVPEAARGFPQCSHAGAAKAGIVSLTASWAREWGPRGVRANAIAPGLVPTDSVIDQVFYRPESVERTKANIPLGRLGDPVDIAHAALFLCSDAARWITGATLVVDGGMSTNGLSPEGV